MPPETFRILLVEDNPGDARLVREHLKNAAAFRADLAHAERLSDAQRVLGTDRFDVVLLDLSLPDSKGLDTIVGAKEHARGIPIVVLTGLDDEGLAVQALHEGAQDYLVKGRMDGSSVSRAIRYAIERHRLREELQAETARRKTEEMMRKGQTGHLWRPLHHVLGQGAAVVLFQAGAEAGSTMYDFLVVTWKPKDQRELLQALAEHLRLTGLANVLQAEPSGDGTRLEIRAKDTFESSLVQGTNGASTCYFFKGLFYGVGAKILMAPELVCDETACQSRGDEACMFVVRPMFA